MILDSKFSWRHPYGWRTYLRTLLPLAICEWIEKGEDCESRGAQHYWYNQDGKMGACYYCRIVRPGRLWEKKLKNSQNRCQESSQPQ